MQVFEGYVRRSKQWANGGLGKFAKRLTLVDDVDGYFSGSWPTYPPLFVIEVVPLLGDKLTFLTTRADY